MGHPSRNPFKLSRLGLDEQAAVDAYKAASIWGAWWQLDESTRRRYFTADERRFIARYGARLDALACMRTDATTDDEKHFVQVCAGRAEPRSARERLWLYAQLVCRYERSLARAARTDLAEHRAAAFEAEARGLRKALREAEEVAMDVMRDYRLVTGDPYEVRRRSLCNVVHVSLLFRPAEAVMGPPAMRPLVSVAHRGAPVQTFPPGNASRIAQ